MRNDLDPVETSEWRDAFDSVLEFDGADRAGFLLEELIDEARRKGAPVPYSANTPYVNTIPPDQQPAHPGDRELEHRIRSLIRWNAVAIVLRAKPVAVATRVTPPQPRAKASVAAHCRRILSSIRGASARYFCRIASTMVVSSIRQPSSVFRKVTSPTRSSYPFAVPYL
jgi:hypothetical protein